MRLSRATLQLALLVLAGFQVHCKDSNDLTGPPTQQTSVVSGSVTRGGLPVPGTRVSIHGVGDAETAQDGTFTIRQVPPGTWTVRVVTGCTECSEFTKSVTVPPDATGLQLIWEQD